MKKQVAPKTLSTRVKRLEDRLSWAEADRDTMQETIDRLVERVNFLLKGYREGRVK